MDITVTQEQAEIINNDRKLRRDELAERYGESQDHPIFTRISHTDAIREIKSLWNIGTIVDDHVPDYWKWVEFQIANVGNMDVIEKVDMPPPSIPYHYEPEFIEKYAFLREDFNLKVEELEIKYSPKGDGEHPAIPRAEWRSRVSHEETILGYWQYLARMIEYAQETLYGMAEARAKIIATDVNLSVGELKKKYSDHHPVFVRKHWLGKIMSDNTFVTGYWEWVEEQLELEHLATQIGFAHPTVS